MDIGSEVGAGASVTSSVRLISGSFAGEKVGLGAGGWLDLTEQPTLTMPVIKLIKYKMIRHDLSLYTIILHRKTLDGKFRY